MKQWTVRTPKGIDIDPSGITTQSAARTASGKQVPHDLTIPATRSDGLEVEIHCTLRESGSYQAHKITVQGETVSTADLRHLPITHLVNEGVRQARVFWGKNLAPALFQTGDVPDEVKQQWPRGDRQQVFDWVARIYPQAIMEGIAPTQSVADSFGVSRSTAKRMISAARQANALEVSSAYDPTKRKDRSNSNGGEVRDQNRYPVGDTF